MTTWLITGGCGFIGRNLVARLLEEEDCEIRVLDNLKVGRREDLEAALPSHRQLPGAKNKPAISARLEFVQGDILDNRVVRTAAAGRDVLIHLAASTGVMPSIAEPLHDFNVNIVGTLNCLEAARHAGMQRFVFASSGASLGEVELPIHEERAPRPNSPYGASKLAGEAYCSAYWRSYGLETVALRFGNVYGPHSDHKSSVVATFIKNALAGEPLIINGDGRQTCDLIFIDDLVGAVCQAATVPEATGHVFQVATGRETTVIEVAELLAEILRERGLPSIHIVHGPVQIGDVRRNFSDTSKARQLLRWRAEVPLREGLGRTVDWFLRHHA